MRPLDPQVVVIAGASSGVGRCTALHLADRGACVVVFARVQDIAPEAYRRVLDVNRFGTIPGTPRVLPRGGPSDPGRGAAAGRTARCGR